MESTALHAQDVIHALRTYKNRITEIMDLIGEKSTVSTAEKAHLQELLAALKQDIKTAAKQGTISKTQRQQSQIESAYFEPAVRSAAANFTVATNSHPIASDWLSCLYGLEMDIGTLLDQLERQYPEG